MTRRDRRVRGREGLWRPTVLPCALFRPQWQTPVLRLWPHMGILDGSMLTLVMSTTARVCGGLNEMSPSLGHLNIWSSNDGIWEV